MYFDSTLTKIPHEHIPKSTVITSNHMWSHVFTCDDMWFWNMFIWNFCKDMKKKKITTEFSSQWLFNLIRGCAAKPIAQIHFSFQVVGDEYRSGTLTTKLRRHVMTGNLNNTFTLWVSKTKPYRPIRYETVGFDLLIRAHYDHYFLDYVTFDEWIIDFGVMQIPEG